MHNFCNWLLLNPRDLPFRYLQLEIKAAVPQKDMRIVRPPRVWDTVLNRNQPESQDRAHIKMAQRSTQWVWSCEPPYIALCIPVAEKEEGERPDVFDGGKGGPTMSNLFCIGVGAGRSGGAPQCFPTGVGGRTGGPPHLVYWKGQRS